MVEYDIAAEEPTLDGVDKAAVTPLVKEALAKKRREEMLQQRTWSMGVSSEGILTPLPPDFTFPQMNMNGLITKWFLGDKKNNIPPYRLLQANNNFIEHVKNGKRDISKMGKVMEKVKQFGMTVDAWPSDRLDGSKVATLYSKVWPRYAREARRKKRGKKSSGAEQLENLLQYNGGERIVEGWQEA